MVETARLASVLKSARSTTTLRLVQIIMMGAKAFLKSDVYASLTKGCDQAKIKISLPRWHNSVVVKFVGPSDMTGTFSHRSGKICLISRPDVWYVFYETRLNQNFRFKHGVRIVANLNWIRAMILVRQIIVRSNRFCQVARTNVRQVEK